jgi:hypothetical protein
LSVKGRFRDPVARFFEKVVAGEDGCWIWAGGIASTYGRFFLTSTRAYIGAHRFSWELVNGPIPDDMTIDHLCFVRRCVNPAHMEVVTQAENNRRAAARKTHCPQGHEYTEANTYVWGGKRQCRECKHQHDLKRRARVA